MMVQRSIIFLLLVLVVFVGCGEDEPEISSIEDLKDTDAKNIIWEKDGAKMVLIEGFERTKTKDTYDEFGDLVPGGVVSDSIYMDTTEVTVGQFKKFLKSSGYKPESGWLARNRRVDWDGWLYKYSPTDEHPMVNVYWYDATAYCEWAGKRLPTEAEWEFAARGGLVGKDFPWGDDETVAREYANYKGSGGKDLWHVTTAPVGSLKPNGYGLFDMSGNVWEWCQDWYSEDKIHRVLRGGGWKYGLRGLRVSVHGDPAPGYGERSRGFASPRGNSSQIGFRCVTGF